ncbi:hypothetical protein [Nodularia spumigena]|uniref:hypothetical protein n=1 Tax=Nodularia spumigena TaxID=70799 RepID=UPI0023301C00|nr:hypothetical protein [Nodularia spumigena]MDB9317407.1 hypothetical protein [Nodularia spumigena CS-590/01A]MDB9321602.1 hypothetical protein [Nodularia spumigena CS-591/07A]MDB9332871.1 hypothetical protein [Nodularia spumigena CS-591/04]MDB9339644.1 hypothetical protein [Nodularia spumigena CS-589/07]MDB9359609.1 hypothetical protein [Nodularia spumigena CS-588/02]
MERLYSRAVSFPKRVKIARVKQIKIEGKSTIRTKNFGVFSPKYLIFLCVFAPLREMILLTNLQNKRMKQPCVSTGVLTSSQIVFILQISNA